MSSDLNFSIAPAVESTTAPPIPRAQAWGREYVASNLKSNEPGGELLDLSQGVPRCAPHSSVLEALGSTSISSQTARYGSILGEPSLREALATEINYQYQLSSSDNPGAAQVQAKDVGITTGCNMAFLAVVMALCPPNQSEVLVPLPSYFNNSMSLNLCSVNPVYIPCLPQDGFKASLKAAKEYLQQRFSSTNGSEVGDGEKRRLPKMIVITSPNNPSGAVYSSQELLEWYNLAKEYKIALVVDETYRDFVESPTFVDGDNDDAQRVGKPHALFEQLDWRGTLISLGSFSKGYRIPGHRLGSIIASPTLLHHLTTICDCMQICAPRAPQLALAPLLPSLRSDILSSSIELSNRRDLFTKTINAINGWKVLSTGGFFAYVSFPTDYLHASASLGLKRKNLASEDIARVLATKLGVVVLPGSFFMPDFNDADTWDKVVQLGGEELKQDRWLRFAVANVSDEVVIKLGPRLRQMNKLMGMVEDEDED